MTLQQLEYVLAIAQEGSMTKAAHKLFKAQPNISNAIQDLEAELGIRIFERSPRGMLLTPEGEELLIRANSIVQQTKQLENYFVHEKPKGITLRISIARASYITVAISEWINTYAAQQDSMQIHFTETNTNSIIEAVISGQADLGIIRIPANYQDLYDETLKKKGLVQKTLMEFPMRIVCKRSHPLAVYQNIPYELLSEYTEIVHGDEQFPIIKGARINKKMLDSELNSVLRGRHVYVYDRGSQISLLDTIKDSYMWASPIPLGMLDLFDMVLKDCSFAKNMNRDIMITRKSNIKNPYLQNCMGYLMEFAERLQDEMAHKDESVK